LEGFSYIRPTHVARRKWQLSPPFGRKEEEGFDE